MSVFLNLFGVVDCKSDDEKKQINQSYNKLRLLTHPDKNLNNPLANNLYVFLGKIYEKIIAGNLDFEDRKKDINTNSELEEHILSLKFKLNILCEIYHEKVKELNMQKDQYDKLQDWYSQMKDNKNILERKLEEEKKNYQTLLCNFNDIANKNIKLSKDLLELANLKNKKNFSNRLSNEKYDLKQIDCALSSKNVQIIECPNCNKKYSINQNAIFSVTEIIACECGAKCKLIKCNKCHFYKMYKRKNKNYSCTCDSE